MAELGPGPYRTGDIADTLGVKTTTLGPARASRIKKGRVYSPPHGEMAFTVPLFCGFCGGPCRRSSTDAGHRAGG